MPSSTPDWSALASQHEKLVTGQTDKGPSAPVPATEHRPDAPAQRGARAGSARRPLRRRRASLGAAAATAAAVAVTGAAGVPASAGTAAAPSWHLVKQLHSGGEPNFSAVVAVGKTGGWAFNQGNSPTAWRRSGSTWTKTSSFPGKRGDFVAVAEASSAINVWAFVDGLSGKSRTLRWNGTTWKAEGTFSRQIVGAVVLSRDDVWIFGEPVRAGSGLGAWHYNGRSWTHVKSGGGLSGGSGLSAKNVRAFSRTNVAHWNGRTWTQKSVAGLLPAKTTDNGPTLFAMYARSASSVWAIGNGGDRPDGGPLVILHYNGHHWSRVPLSTKFAGFGDQDQLAPDGHGGLWIPMAEIAGGDSVILHYSGGLLTAAKLPVAASKIDVTSIAAIPGTTEALAGGFTHAAFAPATNSLSAILQFKS
jgi:hypothetical protein